MLSQTARRQQWGLSYQQRVTRLWQRVTEYEENNGSFYQRALNWITGYVLRDTEDDYMDIDSLDGYSRLMGLYTSRIASAGYDDARRNLFRWTMEKRSDLYSFGLIDDDLEQRKSVIRLSLHLLESMADRTSQVFHELGDLYLSGLAPYAAVYSSAVEGIQDSSGESLDGWLTEALPLLADRPHEFSNNEVPSLSGALHHILNVSDQWKFEQDQSDLTLSSTQGLSSKVNFSTPPDVKSFQWWDYQVARAHFRSARDVPEASQRDRAKASFSMGTMALLGQGGPVDYQLAKTHFTNMRLWDRSTERIEFILISVMIPLLRKFKEWRFSTSLRTYVECSLILLTAFVIHSIIQWFRVLDENSSIPWPLGFFKRAKTPSASHDASNNALPSSSPPPISSDIASRLPPLIEKIDDRGDAELHAVNNEDLQIDAEVKEADQQRRDDDDFVAPAQL